MYPDLGHSSEFRERLGSARTGGRSGVKDRLGMGVFATLLSPKSAVTGRTVSSLVVSVFRTRKPRTPCRRWCAANPQRFVAEPGRTRDPPQAEALHNDRGCDARSSSLRSVAAPSSAVAKRARTSPWGPRSALTAQASTLVLFGAGCRAETIRWERIEATWWAKRSLELSVVITSDPRRWACSRRARSSEGASCSGILNR